MQQTLQATPDDWDGLQSTLDKERALRRQAERAARLAERALRIRWDEEHATHLLYATTDGLLVKVGMTTDLDERIRRDPGQFKGHLVIGTLPCSCMPTVRNARTYCERELWFADQHDRDRLPRSELYRASDAVINTLCGLYGEQPKASAVIEWLIGRRDDFIGNVRDIRPPGN